jgi:hypothetical protein
VLAPAQIDEHPDEARQQRRRDEPLTPDELLRRDAACHVDVVAAGSRPHDGEQEHAEDRQAYRDALLRADDRVPGQRERGHELEQALAE